MPPPNITPMPTLTAPPPLLDLNAPWDDVVKSHVAHYDWQKNTEVGWLNRLPTLATQLSTALSWIDAINTNINTKAMQTAEDARHTHDDREYIENYIMPEEATYNFEQIDEKFNHTERIQKIEFDLYDLDPEKMYPVVFQFGTGNRGGVSEINLGRDYWEDEGRDPSPFSDNSSTSHISGLLFRVVGNGHGWGGSSWRGAKISVYQVSYMHCMQFPYLYRVGVYVQDVDDTVFDSDTTQKPTGGNPVHSGFYLRGGLKYHGYTKNLSIQPTLYTEPTRIMNSSSYGSQWVAPYDYDPENNPEEINNYV